MRTTTVRYHGRKTKRGMTPVREHIRYAVVYGRRIAKGTSTKKQAENELVKMRKEGFRGGKVVPVHRTKRSIGFKYAEYTT